MTATGKVGDLFTAEQCEEIFMAALGKGDTRGMEAALRILCIHEPHRAGYLLELTKLALSAAGHMSKEIPDADQP